MTEVLPPQLPSINIVSPSVRRSSSESRMTLADVVVVEAASPTESSQSIAATTSDHPPRATTVDHSHSSVVPSYPYNVAMLPQSHNGGPTPDDSGITTRLPSICVDYLSHDWAEDDVWTSWKAMTRHKSEIANGVRLENASWRTWAKQRGKLKTISPETLNWLKDSDVTWLYGPLHTAVDAVPPPKIATASDRLGLEPLRSLSDSKKVQKVVVVTKPILKYRSLSDILLPQGTSPASPILESFGMDFDGDSTFVHAKSDSNLARLNREANRKRSSSPHVARGRDSSSEEPALSDSSSASGATTTRNGERRHISFNHRVEQCIAVDSSDETSTRPSSSNDSSGSEDGDDEDEVLTFRSSSRVAQVAASLRRRSEKEPLTIYRLGPTTLKSLELYPSPSPAVVYQNRPDEDDGIPQSSYGQSVATYSSRPTASNHSGGGSGSDANGRRVVYEYDGMGSDGLPQSQWDEEEDYAMGFDYFSGPEVGVGDEYDMAQYGSAHLVGGSHNNYAAGGAEVQYGPYPTPGPYSPDAPSSGSNSPGAGSIGSSPGHSRRSSAQESSLNSNARGSHVPPSSSKDSLVPKRSILKNRSRQNSDNSDDARFLSGSYSPSLVSPDHSVPPSPTSTSSSPQSSPYSSASSLSTVMAGGGIPSIIQLRDSTGAIRRVDSTDLVREARGRSTSRGSSSSLERSASADRRTSSSISPSSSYSPPSSIVPPATATLVPRAAGLPGARSRSSESLISLAGSMAGRELMPDVPEASSESEAETVQAGTEDESDEHSRTKRAKLLVPGEEIPASSSSSSSSSSSISAADSAMADVVGIDDVIDDEQPTTHIASTSAPALLPIPSSSGPPRYRQPSPSAPTTSTTSTMGEDDSRNGDALLTGSSTISIDAVDATFSTSSAPIDEDAAPVESYARRSLLRASRGGSHISSSSSDREGSIGGGRGSFESGRSGSGSGGGGGGSSSHDDAYGFGYYDEDSDGGIVSRTLEVAGTVRDLLGALSRGIWRRERPAAATTTTTTKQ